MKVSGSPSRSVPVRVPERGASSFIVYPESDTVGGLLNIVTLRLTVPVLEIAPL